MYAYMLKNLGTNETTTYQEHERFCTASIVKVAVAMALFYEEKNGTLVLLKSDLQKIQKMIIESDNDCTTYFWKKLGGETYMNTFFQVLAMNETSAGKNGFWGLTETTAHDQILLLTYLVKENEYITKNQQQNLLSLMKDVKQDQKWGYSSVKDGEIYVKNGWSPKEKNNWRINSLGIIEHQNEVYISCVLSIGHETYEKGVEGIETYIKKITHKKLSR